ncbi:MAG TPA: hypothetical protein GXX55_11090 [Firmicutes bacterium]|nr:hypothetical protein [Bacillota bacterium]
MIRFGAGTALLFAGLLQLTNALALVLHGSVSTAPWQLLLGLGGRVFWSGAPDSALWVEAWLRLGMGALLVWPGLYLLRSTKGKGLGKDGR